jgi:dTDP-glucose pyrophosphorylase/predicted transcriptional regulator
MKDWSKTVLDISDNLENAITVLHNGGLRVALVVDKNNKLIGTITDGDIRRALLKHLTMDCSVKEIMFNNPTVAKSSDSRDAVLQKMKNRDLLHIPIVDNNEKLIGLETLQNLTYDKQYDNPVFLMAGGLGKRLRPLTEDTPKPLLKVGDKPILEIILDRFIKAGFHNFYISTFYQADKIRQYFGDGSSWDVSINYIEENKPLGTAGSISLLPKDLPNLPILMMNGDVLTKVNFEHLLNFHNKQDGIATMCIREYDVQIPFGVVSIENQKAQNFEEKPVKKFFVNAGIYVYERKMIDKVKVDEYIDMPTLLEQQIKNGSNINVFPIHEYWKDVGHMDEYENVNKSFNNGFSIND